MKIREIMRNRIFVVIFAICAFFVVKSQDNYVSGMLFFQTEIESEAIKANFAPEFGHFLNETVAIGASLKYQYEKNAAFEHVIILEPYLRKYFIKQEKLGIFVDAIVGPTFSFPNDGDFAVGFKAGLAPGLDVKLTDKFSFVSRLGFLGYYQPGDFDGKKYVRLSFDASGISFGVRYNL